jgi:predicted nucleic acid-binding protein
VIKTIIADTGVIVGLIYEKDQWHKWAFEQSKNLAPPFLTCEAVITEACYLLKNVKGGKENVLGMVADGFLQIDFSLEREAAAVKDLLKKYADVPMDFADACVVRMSELIENSIVFTVDGDFLIYRKHGKKEIPLIIPDKV